MPPARTVAIRRNKAHVLGAEFVSRQNEIVEAQTNDVNISPIREAILNSVTEPSWDWAQPRSEETNTLWRQWDRLVVTEGILVRMFEEADGTKVWPQVVMPKNMRSEFLRNRTELSVRARAYWPGWCDDVRRALKTCCEYAQGTARAHRAISTNCVWRAMGDGENGCHRPFSYEHPRSCIYTNHAR